jgi:hypothetical protein
LNRKNRNPHCIGYAVALAIFCLAALSGCKSKPAGITLADLSGWSYLSPDSVGVGEPCTFHSFIYNRHLTDTAYVDSTTLDTLVVRASFDIPPLDTVAAVYESNIIYQTPGTYIHTLTFFTTIGALICPPCTVRVESLARSRDR